MQRPPRPKYLSLIVIFAAQLFLFSPFHLTAAPQTSDESKLLQAREKGKRQSAYLAGKSESIEKPKLKANLSQFKKQIQPLLVKACTQCHGPEEQEGNIRIDTLDPNLFEGKDVQWWLEVFAVVSNSEMPPPEEKLLSEPERVQIINWLKNELKHASEARQSQKASTSFRRMTNYEFNYALQDLLGLPFDFARDLPKEVMLPGGFENSSGSLRLSISQLENFRRVARKALDRAIVTGERPPTLFWSLPIQKLAKIDWQKQNEELAKTKTSLKDDPQAQKEALDRLLTNYQKPPRRPAYKELNSGRHLQASWAYQRAQYSQRPEESDVAKNRVKPAAKYDWVAVLPQGRNQKLIVELGDQLPEKGIMRVRVRAAKASKSAEDRPSLRLEFGFQASNEGRSVIKVGRDITPIVSEDFQFYEWKVPLGDIYPRNSVKGRYPLGVTPSPSEYIKLVNDSMNEGSVLVDYIEIEAPYFQQWPPASHRRIFAQKGSLTDENTAAKEILLPFMEKAWRRPVSQTQLQRKLTLFEKIRPICDSFEEAIRETLATVIASPQFLFVGSPALSKQTNQTEVNKQLNAHELANRLSFFLWCSLPDDELRKLADNGTILDKKVRAGQVNRMLADPRAQRMSRHFVHQWLHLENLEYVNFAKTYRGLDPELKPAMLSEPVQLFNEIVDHNRSVLDFIHADYLVINSRLATHYGIPGVKGNHFRSVKPARQINRGGLLTSAGILTMNSDGEDSHPLKRGVWMLEKILNDPPPPPPPAVPEIDLSDPNIAKMTLKERIENHRDHAACMSCHIKIDPWGLAFENFDASGRWRTKVGNQKVDSTSYLFNKEKLDGIGGLKKHLLEKRQDQFVRGLATKLTAFALGRPLAFEDHAELESIALTTRKRKDGLVDMIRAIVESELFLQR